MDKHSSALARSLGVIAVAVAGTMLPVTGARAEVSVTQPQIAGWAGAYHSGGGGCSTSVEEGDDSAPLPLTGAPLAHTTTGSATVTEINGPRTQITMSATGKGSASLRNGQLSTVDLTGTGRVELTADPGQTCGASAWAATELSLGFKLARPQWVEVTGSSDRQTNVWIDGSDLSGTTWVAVDRMATAGALSHSSYLPVGTYDLEAGFGWTPAIVPGQAKVLRAGSGVLRLRLFDAGSAYAAATGNGRGFVSLGNQVSCAGPSLPARFSSRAGRVRSASFIVNGTVAKTVRKPKAGQRVSVPVRSRFDKATVRTRLVIDPPGAARKATVSVMRSYRPCDAR